MSALEYGYGIKWNRLHCLSRGRKYNMPTTIMNLKVVFYVSYRVNSLFHRWMDVCMIMSILMRYNDRIRGYAFSLLLSSPTFRLSIDF